MRSRILIKSVFTTKAYINRYRSRDTTDEKGKLV